jgi:RNA polymerase sigma-70 factor, ECF subfamily
MEIDGCYNRSIALELGLTRSDFAEIVTGVIEPFDRSHWDDLLLARACALGYEAAWNRFLLVYRQKLYSAALAITKDASLARDLADSLYADLYGTKVGAEGKRVSKFDSYLGRGSFEGWLDASLERTMTAAAEEPDCRAAHAQIAQATDAALDTLSSEERLLLATYYLDGRTLAEVGRMLALHESTVSRRLDKVTAMLRKQIIANLRAAGLSKGEAAKLLELDVRDIGVDVRRSLAQERPAGTF